MEVPDTNPDLYLDLGRDQLGYQLGAADAIEAKAGTWFGVGSTLTGLLVALVALKPPTSGIGILLAVLAAVAYLAMAVASMVIFFGSAWGTGPKLDDLERNRQNDGWTDVQTKWVAFRRIRDDLRSNQTPYKKRLVGLRVIAVSLAAETLILALLALTLALAKTAPV
jgi:hypothetical protein